MQDRERLAGADEQGRDGHDCEHQRRQHARHALGRAQRDEEQQHDGGKAGERQPDRLA